MQKRNPRQSSFAERVHAVVRRIPLGKTLTYKEVAVKTGSPNASRAVGSLMAKNFNTDIPCHRVIKSDGTIGNYNRGGAKKKKEILENEKRLSAKNNK